MAIHCPKSRKRISRLSLLTFEIFRVSDNVCELETHINNPTSLSDRKYELISMRIEQIAFKLGRWNRCACVGIESIELTIAYVQKSQSQLFNYHKMVAQLSNGLLSQIKLTKICIN